MSTLHLFSQLSSLINRNLVNSAAKRFHSDKFCHNLDTWTHLVSLLFCHPADCQSLRDICKGMRAIRGWLNHLGIRRIWTAMIAALLLQHLKNKSKRDWHMSNLVTFIRIHLMSYIDMWEWVNERFEKPHSPPQWT